MTGTMTVYVKGEAVEELKWTSKENCRGIYDLWIATYKNPVIHIYPTPRRCDITLPPKRIKKLSTKKDKVSNLEREINMTDFVEDQGMKHETYFHRCYCKGEK